VAHGGPGISLETSPKIMKMLILGASGGIGRWVVRLAAAKGHPLRALVRPGAVFEAPPGAVEVLRGEVLDLAVLKRAVSGVDAVICCLGQRRSSASPWSRPLSPPDLMTRVGPALVEAMHDAEVRRLAVVSAGGVGESARQLTGPVRWLVRQGRIATAYQDLEAMERTLAASDLDWLAVRPVTLTNGEPTRAALEVERYTFLSGVRRADVAAWLVDAVGSEAPLGRRAVLLGS
jgi:uncharacterized protein YbjT (DUF2867 family)